MLFVGGTTGQKTITTCYLMNDTGAKTSVAAVRETPRRGSLDDARSGTISSEAYVTRNPLNCCFVVQMSFVSAKI